LAYSGNLIYHRRAAFYDLPGRKTVLSVCAKKEKGKKEKSSGENAIVVHCRRVQVVQNSQKIRIQIKEERSGGTVDWPFRLCNYPQCNGFMGI
jgi:hypothetical protein